jgi:hypothetical protein
MARIKAQAPKRGARIKLHDAPAQVNWDKRTPVFSLRHLIKTHGLDRCSQEQKAGILDSFYRRNELTWERIKMAPRHGLGTEKIDQSAIKVPLPGHITPDTTLLALRCIGLMPMIGFREDDRFHLLWIDLDFDCYDH